MITNREAGTRIEEVARDLYRISTPVPPSMGPPTGFSFNQYLLVDEEPLLFHTGPRRMFPLVREAITTVIPPEGLRWIGFSHVESDECGSLNEFLAVAPRAQPLCSGIAAMVSVQDLADRPPRGLEDGETLRTGAHALRFLYTPHLPHGWECGYLFDETSRTLLCGDLFTQPGTGGEPVVESDILGPSEALRAGLDYFAHAPTGRAHLERLAGLAPETLACMHGSAWRGDGGAILRALADAIERPAR